MTTSSLSNAPANWLDTSTIGAEQTAKAAKPVGEDPTATKEMFLQLLVAQIKNQNPLNPADGSEFLAQLSQFTQVEQTLAMREELTAIKDILAAAAE